MGTCASLYSERDVREFALDLEPRHQSNILWTQRGNLFGVSTDCPQRDERQGWLGDAQTFSQTACFNMDMAAFYTTCLIFIRGGNKDKR